MQQRFWELWHHVATFVWSSFRQRWATIRLFCIWLPSLRPGWWDVSGGDLLHKCWALMKGSTNGQLWRAEGSDTPHKSVAVRCRSLISCQLWFLQHPKRKEKKKSLLKKHLKHFYLYCNINRHSTWFKGTQVDTLCVALPTTSHTYVVYTHIYKLQSSPLFIRIP